VVHCAINSDQRKKNGGGVARKETAKKPSKLSGVIKGGGVELGFCKTGTPWQTCTKRRSLPWGGFLLRGGIKRRARRIIRVEMVGTHVGNHSSCSQGGFVGENPEGGSSHRRGVTDVCRGKKNGSAGKIPFGCFSGLLQFVQRREALPNQRGAKAFPCVGKILGGKVIQGRVFT